ncbi:Uncharacterised protein [uncultured Clostridium sp.]|nr:Uncharacterised protein [uncultured Clostridium sp.]
MFIKLKIEGELLELLQEDADESVRTCTQQAMYIIKSYYKDGMHKKNYAQTEIMDEDKVSNSSSGIAKSNESTNKELEEPIVIYEELEATIDNSELIDDDIYDF